MKAIPVELPVMLPPNTFLNADCMDYLPKCPAGYFNLAIVDPPYGIDWMGQIKNPNLNKNWKKHTSKNWDASPPVPEYFEELKRVSKNQVIWGGNYFDLPKTRCWLIWDKMQEFNGSDFEMAWTSFDKPSKIFRMARCQAYVGRDKIHPTQKPEELYRWTLKYLGRAGDLILDTHVGSGSSLIACKELGFNYAGFEIDKEYFEGADKRVRRAFRKYELNFEQNEAAT